MGAGFTYLGQFIDHDLTFDKTGVMEGVDISPVDIEQSRSPSLDLDSLYGAGPLDPGSAKFYCDGLHLKMGRRVRRTAHDGLRPSAGRLGRESARGAHPGPAQRRESRRRADAPGVHQVPQSGRRHASRRDAPDRALRSRAEDRHQALPVDDPHGLPAEDLRALASSRTCSPTIERRSRSTRSRTACRPCRSSSRSPPSGSDTA